MTTLAFGASCSSSGAPAPAASDASADASVKAATPTFGASACGACVQSACVSAVDACQTNPECPAFLDCLLACPLGADGNVEAACAAACPTGSSSESKQAAAAISACRSVGPGAACSECAALVGAEPKTPVLNQTCNAPSTAPNACGVCQDTHCCDTISACHADADCQAFHACLKGCAPGDAHATCFRECSETHPGGTQLFGENSACGVYYCAIEQTTCVPATRDQCEHCLHETCGDQEAAFVSSETGYALQLCVQTCRVDDAACDNVCYAKYPKAMDAYFELAQCLAVACKGKC